MKLRLFGIMMVLLILTACQEEPAPKADLIQTTYALDTVITINLYDQGDQALMDRLINRITEIEEKMAAQWANSEVARINQAAGKEAVVVSEETYLVIKTALEYAALSDGRFDPTVGPIITLWGIGTEEARVPSQEEIDEALTFVDYQKVILEEATHAVYLEEVGMSIDLGGIAKGYVADALVAILKEEGLTKGMINLGGNIYAYGSKGEGKPWRVAIQTPYDTRNTYFGILDVVNKTVVTSGPYERYFEEDGQFYHHIFNAKTGYPTTSDVASVSILADSSMDADALSTLLFTMEPDEGMAFIEGLEGFEAIYVDKEYRLTISSGLKASFTLTDSTYTIKE